MKRAIVAGANGLIGRALIEELIKNKILVLALGTAKNLHKNLKEIKNSKIIYYQVKKNNCYTNLFRKIKKKFKTDQCVFFNLAWRGKTRLTDGEIKDQLKNINFCCELIKLAHNLKIKKYVATGSMEEVMLKRFIEKNYWLNKKISQPSWYALSKFSAWMQTAFEAYNKKIDFCYARISVVIDVNLNTNKFVENSFKNLLKNIKIDLPKNYELCNICSSNEIARQLIAIAKYGKNKKIYTLGTGECNSLENFFYQFSKFINPNLNIIKKLCKKKKLSLLRKNDFNIKNLTVDTRYKPNENIKILFKKLLNLKK